MAISYYIFPKQANIPAIAFVIPQKLRKEDRITKGKKKTS